MIAERLDADPVKHRPGRVFLLLAAGTGCWLGATGQAQAFPITDALTPSILAPQVTGADQTVGQTTDQTTGQPAGQPTDLTSQVGVPGIFAGVPEPGWTFTPRVALQTGYNSNALATHNNPSADWVNYLTAGLTVRANTDRVKGQFDYAPTLGLYARNSSLNYLAQTFSGNGSITFVPDLFYMDLRGFAGVQPRNGAGFGSTGTGTGASVTGLPPNQLNQTSSFSVTPYLMHRFGEYGTGKIGYSFNSSNSRPVTGFGTLPFIGTSSSSVPTSSLSPTAQAQLSQNGILNQNYNTITNEEVAQFQTGEFLGRFNNLTIATGNQYTGSATTNNGYQYTFNNQLGYAVSRRITVFGALGYEDIHYQGIPPTNINDATWQVGAKLTPNEDSTITLGYGHQYGINAFFANAGYQVTPRLRVNVSYNTGIGNGLTQLQNNVSVSDVDQYGYQVNALTGAPLFNATGLFGSNSNLYRTKTFTGSATLNLDRDVIMISAYVSEQQLLATSQAVTGARANTTSTTGYASWTHQLWPSLTSIVSGSYTTQPSQAAALSGSQTTVTANLTFQYQFNPTLTGSAQYAYYERNSPVTLLSFTQNVFLLGISKSF